MKTYRFTGLANNKPYIEVKANSPKQAKEKAMDIALDADNRTIRPEVSEVTKVPKLLKHKNK